MQQRSIHGVFAAMGIIILGTFFGAPLHAQQDPTLAKQYLEIYMKLHDSEALLKNGDNAAALKGFQDCRDRLAAIQKSNPDWETALVLHRMEDCQVTIEKLQNTVDTPPGKPPNSAGDATTAAAIQKVQADFAAPTNGAPATAPVASKRNVYPWKLNIFTTMFYIGEDSSSSSAWDENWVQHNHGSDAVSDGISSRNGYASGSHASTVNPFYVALPFNDLAHPDKAKKWLPAGWERTPQDGKPVSACKDRWVEIKTEDGSGRVCYAQWEDVGPNGNDHAEYVFGPESPQTGNRAGLDVSPAVAQYLGLADDKDPRTRWRFVDAEDVPPGAWLKYDEQAVLYSAMHDTHTPAASTGTKL